MRSILRLVVPIFATAIAFGACSAAKDNQNSGGAGGSGGATTGPGSGGAGGNCNVCVGSSYTPCDANGQPTTPIVCPEACAPGVGCTKCVPDQLTCVGNDVHKCAADGSNQDTVVETCDVANGKTCSNGKCQTACDVAADSPSNVGCEFWAVDLDQQDGFNDPASAPWGVALSNNGDSPADVTIEINEAPVGKPVQTKLIQKLSVAPGTLQSIILPTRELDCGVKPNDYGSPGTCLSSNAYRITSTAPIVAYQFNVFENAYSNDASLLLPTNALGSQYRILGWGAGHPVKIPGFNILDRSYVTIVGTRANTKVTVKPSWKIKGNPPVAPTPAGGDIQVTIGPFDVLNLETDDGSFGDDPKTIADLSGSLVLADQPVAVYSGVESTGAPGVFDIPKPPGWDMMSTCCLDHLEEQIFPIESVGMHYVAVRSPVRSTGNWHEPDVIRFVGVAETANVTTSLAPPFDHFTIQPGEVKTTYAQEDAVINSDKPVMVGQLLISQDYVDGPALGDPALTIFVPVEQYRNDYLILTPKSWTQSWIVIAAPSGANITIDNNPTTTCITNPAGNVMGVNYESRRCTVTDGVHKLTGDKPFGIIAYGYGTAGSYALSGGAAVKHVYDPPPLK
jgi:hypothetical protein